MKRNETKRNPPKMINFKYPSMHENDVYFDVLIFTLFLLSTETASEVPRANHWL